MKCFAQGSLPKWTSAEDKPFEIETFHENSDALVQLSEEILLGDEDIFENKFSGV